MVDDSNFMITMEKTSIFTIICYDNPTVFNDNEKKTTDCDNLNVSDDDVNDVSLIMMN